MDHTKPDFQPDSAAGPAPRGSSPGRCPACGTPAEPEDLFCGQCRHRLGAAAPGPVAPARGRSGCGTCLGVGCLGSGLVLMLAVGLLAWVMLSPLEYAPPVRTPPALGQGILGGLPAETASGDLVAMLPSAPPAGVHLKTLRLFDSGRSTSSLEALGAVATPDELQTLARLSLVLPGRAITAGFVDEKGREWTVAVLIYEEPRWAWDTWQVVGLSWIGGVYTGLQGTYALVHPSGGRTELIFQKGPYLVVGATPPGQDYAPLHEILRTFQL